MSVSGIRLRFRIELILAVVSVLLAGVTFIWPNWIEILFEAEPDAGDGSLERAISLVFLLVAAVSFVLARLDFRRLARIS
jgi:hypothetical protein